MPSVSERVLKKYDKDGNGNVDVHEFRVQSHQLLVIVSYVMPSSVQEMVMEMGHFLSPEEYELAILQLDTNGDGEVEYSEFKVWWSNNDRFAKLRLEENELAAVQEAGVLS